MTSRQPNGLRDLLEREYSVDKANSGSAAIELASRYTYAVILLDVRMPMMDGFQTAEQLRKNQTSKIPPSSSHRHTTKVMRRLREAIRSVRPIT